MSVCQWVSHTSALAHFVTFRGSPQSQRHIKPLHWYVACRLVVEGGFHPDEIMPRPPFRVEGSSRRPMLVDDPSRGGTGERTVYGGLKTKDVDVVVTKEGIGPVLAVSCKGAIGAFRNLTNRMEEAVGDCTKRSSSAAGDSRMKVRVLPAADIQASGPAPGAAGHV